MSIFERKKEKQKINERRLQILESENAQLNEKCNRYQSALNQATKEKEDYKRKYNELLERASTTSGFSNDEFVGLKEKCDEYKVRLDNANREIEIYKQVSLNYQNQIKKLKEGHGEAVNSGWKLASQKNKKPIFNIMNQVRENPNYMSALYCSKYSFLTTNEYKMYVLLENLIYENRDTLGDLSVFANTRLADIVKLFEEEYNSGDNSFCKNLNKNPNKKKICELIEKYMPNFNDGDYKNAFSYPLNRLHIDFLICDNENDKSRPVLAIELHGSEHDPKSEKADWNRIKNDKFKRELFDSKNKSMNVRLLVIKNEELDDTGKLTNIIFEALSKCLTTDCFQN